MIKANKNFVLGVPKFKTKTFIFEYFLKISSEIYSTHPFYFIFISNTSYVKNFILFVGGPDLILEILLQLYYIRKPQLGKHLFKCNSLFTMSKIQGCGSGLRMILDLDPTLNKLQILVLPPRKAIYGSSLK